MEMILLMMAIQQIENCRILVIMLCILTPIMSLIISNLRVFDILDRSNDKKSITIDRKVDKMLTDGLIDEINELVMFGFQFDFNEIVNTTFDQNDETRTPSMVAPRAGNVRFLRFILKYDLLSEKYNADMDIKNKNGWTVKEFMLSGDSKS